MKATYEFEEKDFLPIARVANGLRFLAEQTRLAGQRMDQLAVVLDTMTADDSPLWATHPGEWPDNFTLLNRYLRTGVKPRFLFNK